jgi:hypothetical protein
MTTVHFANREHPFGGLVVPLGIAKISPLGLQSIHGNKPSRDWQASSKAVLISKGTFDAISSGDLETRGSRGPNIY